MGKSTAIEWTDHTANFWWGCFKVSPGCQHCYAETWAKRTGKSIWGPVKTTARELKKAIWKELLKWNAQAKEEGKRRRVFVQSMADFFEDHPQVKEWRWEALALMQSCTWLDFQVLTKRIENVVWMIETSPSHSLSDAGMWFDNYPHIWIGTSVENQEQADKRIPELLQVPAAVRFLSCEPLLGPLDLEDLAYEAAGPVWAGYNRLVDWVIVGGESGHNARPMHPDWARKIRNQCVEAGVPFLFKQWGEWLPLASADEADNYRGQLRDCGRFVKVGKHAAGRLLDGREWNEFPTIEAVA